MVTEPHDWEVRRRLSDFRWLSERLRREFPQLNICLFNGSNKEDVEKYVNSLLTIPGLMKSRFLIFFLSCTNLKKFYERREREFKQTVMKSLSKKFEGIMDTTSKNSSVSGVNLNESNDMSMTDGAILNVLTQADGTKSIQIKGQKLDDNLTIHMFLEDLRFLSKHQREKLSSFRTGLKDLLDMLDSVKTKMMDLGNIFSEIQTSHKELEETGRPEITKIKP